MTGGWGTGWGLTPWGGFLYFTEDTAPEPPSGFDLFCFFNDAASMGAILSDPDVTTVDDEGQFDIDPVTHDLKMVSGGSPPAPTDALITVTSTVPASWSLQMVATFDSLPQDFSDIVNSHIYFGGADISGLAAGLFISKAGLAYTGAAYLVAGNLTLGGPFQPIPGTAGAFVEGISYTLRIAVDATTSTVYVFATKTSELVVTGHQLVAILPGIASAGVVADSAFISVRGTDLRPVRLSVDQFCMGTGLIMPNVPPRADAGRDQAIRACTVGLLDGSGSFDPDGGAIKYSWRVIDAPTGSAFAFEGADGFTVPAVSPNGYTSKFHSAAVGAEDAVDEFSEGDVLVVSGGAYSIIAKGVDGDGYFVQIASAAIVDNLSGAHFKILRQRYISNITSVSPSFLPDVPGIYKFDLVVFDGQYLSPTSTTIVNVLESTLPRGCIPDLGFIWQYLSDFWKLVEDRERIQVLWESMAQVAAAELMTLWQVDYAKSLRDIQRTLQRRWLHYDMKLPEPLPSLTTVRATYGGVTSQPYPAGGVGSVQGRSIVIISPVHDPVTITFGLANPYTAAKIQSILKPKLQHVDPRYDVQIIAVGSNQVLRITAPFFFQTAQGTNLPGFQANRFNDPPAGFGGARISERSYQVEVSLQGLDIKEGDLLVVGDEGYRISRIVDDPTDALRFQRVVVQSDLPLLPGSDWTISSYVTSRLLDFYNGLLTAGDVAVFEVFGATEDSFRLIAGRVSAACGAEVSKLGVDLSPISPYLALSGYTVRLAYVVRRTRLPVGELVTDIPCLQEFIRERDDGAVLRRNVDFFIEQFRGQNSLRFSSGGVNDAGDVWEGHDPPDRLWAEVTYFDNRPTIEGNFGIPAEFTLDQFEEIESDLDYLSAVRGLWYSFLNGPTMYNLRVGAQILLGLPFAEEAGTIEEIRTDFSPNQGRILLRDSANTAIVRAYSYPRSLSLETNPATGARYAVGDSVTQFAPLVEGAEVIDYVKDPKWFQGILSQGAFFEVEKFHKFMARVDSAAFSLSSLMFVRSFILRVKPTYTFPIFVVRSKVGDTEVSVDDTMVMSGRLILNEGACFPNDNAAQMFDDYRAAGGGVRNQFDANSDPNDSPPTYPTSDTDITWGYDKKYLCPEDDISISWCVDHAGGTVPFDAGYSFDAMNSPSFHFTDTGVTSIPAGPTGYTFPGSLVAGVTASIVEARVVISGTLGASPGDYELVVVVNGSPTTAIPFTVTSSGIIADLTASIPVTSGDSITLRLRPATGGARSPVWSYLSVTLSQTPVAFQYDAGLPAGTYCFSRLA